MTEFVFESHALADTERLGAALARVIPDGTVVALCGTLGAGKTRLVQAIAAACGIEREEVVSPTFVICQEHVGRRTIYHFDVYRLKDDDEFQRLGPEEYFVAGGITLIEWADRVTASLPPERIEIAIEVSGESSRRFRVRAFGATLGECLISLAAECQDS